MIAHQSNSNATLNLDLRSGRRPAQDISSFAISATDVLNVLSQFDPYGLWRMDVGTGLVHWSHDVYAIHGMEATDGGVDLAQAMSSYHPDDRKLMAQVIEDSVKNKSAFRFVLRVMNRHGTYKLVKCTGLFRESEQGSPEIFGTYSEFQPANRAIAAI